MIKPLEYVFADLIDQIRADRQRKQDLWERLIGGERWKVDVTSSNNEAPEPDRMLRIMGINSSDQILSMAGIKRCQCVLRYSSQYKG